MTMVEAGKSFGGRTYYFALVSSKENLAKIDRYRAIARRLAHPEGLSDAEAKALAEEGKASFTSTAGCIRLKSQGRSIRRSCSTTS
jgi:hypothetical protein